MLDHQVQEGAVEVDTGGCIERLELLLGQARAGSTRPFTTNQGSTTPDALVAYPS